MMKHRLHGDEWWCLPGGSINPQETPEAAALRELKEECGVNGQVISQTAHATDAEGMETMTFLVEIDEQQPEIGYDPEFALAEQVLADMRWLSLAEIPERDRAYLWAAGLMSIPEFLNEVSHWGNDISYPIK
jgi:ADP-ribose pyrophosphatase YjhB (NUDIX family)